MPLNDELLDGFVFYLQLLLQRFDLDGLILQFCSELLDLAFLRGHVLLFRVLQLAALHLLQLFLLRPYLLLELLYLLCLYVFQIRHLAFHALQIVLQLSVLCLELHRPSRLARVVGVDDLQLLRQQL